MIDKDKIIEHLLYIIEQKDKEIQSLTNIRIDNNVVHGKPHSEVGKLKVFMDVFHGLSTDKRLDVIKDNFIYELVKTGKFIEDEALVYIKKAMQNGQIYERSDGIYAKA
jgi:replicative DNA helicase Mcm